MVEDGAVRKNAIVNMKLVRKNNSYKNESVVPYHIALKSSWENGQSVFDGLVIRRVITYCGKEVCLRFKRKGEDFYGEMTKKIERNVCEACKGEARKKVMNKHDQSQQLSQHEDSFDQHFLAPESNHQHQS